MRIRSDRYSVEDNRRCLVVAPHQDDAALGCGGLIIRKRLEGNPVDLVCVTDGSASHRGHPTLRPEALASQRRSEELAAGAILGVDQQRIHFLGAKDGTLRHLGSAEKENLVGKVMEVLLQISPDEIFLPYRLDNSSEHEASFEIIRSALRRAHMSPRVLEYPIWSLWAPQRLILPLVSSSRIWRVQFAGYENIKLRAIEMYRSQLEPMPPWTEPVLSPSFISFFSSSDEFFFENVGL
jgi:LmbE family N-acetylglucosaminyl deacetylase